MEKFNIKTLLASMERKPINKEVFCTTGNLKAQIMRLQAGASIPPCKMDNDVFFYFLSGEGTITVDNVTLDVAQGECVTVPHQTESRSIHAVTELEILAVQGVNNK